MTAARLLLEWRYYPDGSRTVTLYRDGRVVACAPGESADLLAELVRSGAQAGAQEIEEQIKRIGETA